MWRRSPLVIVMIPAVFVLAALYVIYRVVDPLPPRHLVIAAGITGSGYDNFAKQYVRILARYGVTLEVRNSDGAVEDLNLLRDPGSGVRQRSPPSASRCRAMQLLSIRSAEYLTRRYTFFTGARSP